MKLNLGCGENKKAGWINIDYVPEVNPDLILDLNNTKHNRLPYKDNEIEELNAVDVLEHIENIIPLMNELHRVLVVGGVIHIEVPLAGTVDFYKDPTHVRSFVPETFKYFAEWCPRFYGIKQWKILEMRWTKGGDNQNRIWVTMTPLK
jgi:predicted SAM-dependent methyltransferase